jgi:carbon monoxide dehydrogenase subunit G
VAAVQSALSKTSGHAGATQRSRLGPVGSHPPSEPQDFSRSPKAERTDRPVVQALDGLATDWAAVERDGVELRQSFSVPFARPEVWRVFADLDDRALHAWRALDQAAAGRPCQGEVNVKLGPIVSAFHGVLDVERDDDGFRGVVRGAGRDAKSPSSARAIIAYQVHSLDAAASRVDVSVKFRCRARWRFSRSGLVRDVADHLTTVLRATSRPALRGRRRVLAAMLDARRLRGRRSWARIRASFKAVCALTCLRIDRPWDTVVAHRWGRRSLPGNDSVIGSSSRERPDCPARRSNRPKLSGKGPRRQLHLERGAPARADGITISGKRTDGAQHRTFPVGGASRAVATVSDGLPSTDRTMA